MIKTINFNDMIANKEVLFKRLTFPVEHMLTTYERKCLVALLHLQYHGGNAVEFGTWRGFTTKLLSDSLPKCHIITIDEFNAKMSYNNNEYLPKDEIGMEFKGKGNKITQILKDSKEVDLSKYSKKGFDFVFIDGNHEYSYVRNDFGKAFPYTNRGGVIVFDDYTHGFDLKDPTFKNTACYGVCKFINELSVSSTLYWIEGTSLIYMIK